MATAVAEQPNPLTEGLELATLNIRHFPMFPGLARPFPA